MKLNKGAHVKNISVERIAPRDVLDWKLVDIGAKFQPVSYFDYNFYEGDRIWPKPELSGIGFDGYAPWLLIVHEPSLVSIEVHYPSSVNEDDDIDVVLWYSEEISVKVPWIHGCSGLFESVVIPFIHFIDKLFF